MEPDLDEIRKHAEKYLNRPRWKNLFQSSTKNARKAIELLLEVADKYEENEQYDKLYSVWDSILQAYDKYMLNGDTPIGTHQRAAQLAFEASQALIPYSISESARFIEKAILYSKLENDYPSAARYSAQLASLLLNYETKNITDVSMSYSIIPNTINKNINTDDIYRAIDILKDAAISYKLCGSFSKSSLCSIRLSELLTSLEKYSDAFDIIETILLNRYMDHDQVSLVFRAIICILLDKASYSITEAVINAKNFDIKICPTTPVWAKSSARDIVYKLLDLIEKTYDKFPQESYTSIMQQLDRVYQLNDWFISNLLRLRDILYILESKLL